MYIFIRKLSQRLLFRFNIIYGLSVVERKREETNNYKTAVHVHVQRNHTPKTVDYNFVQTLRSKFRFFF